MHFESRDTSTASTASLVAPSFNASGLVVCPLAHHAQRHLYLLGTADGALGQGFQMTTAESVLDAEGMVAAPFLGISRDHPRGIGSTQPMHIYVIPGACLALCMHFKGFVFGNTNLLSRLWQHLDFTENELQLVCPSQVNCKGV
jgi:hypothetical protein